ncbi:MAG: aspartate aminotransferase family protein [Bacteroidetes bacterium]|nr:aspartate aminotransferase family protein [Bacteroidota bacterium]
MNPGKKLLTIDNAEQLSLKEIKDLYKAYINPVYEDVFSTFTIGSELVERAEGLWLYTRSGKKVLDATGGQGVLNHGHNHPRILAARIRYQERQRMEVHKTIFSPYLAALSANVAAMLPADLNYPFFCNSGAEAVDGAIKMAHKYHAGSRNHILYSDISYHGKLLGAGSITGSKELHFGFPKIPGTRAYEYGNITSIRQALSELRKKDGSSDVYAIFLEPYSASTGRKCDGEYLRELRQICDRENIVLVFDEVFTGWCKTGNLFYFMDHEVVPDILTTSKSIGGGKSSISAFVARTPVLQKTFGNHHDFVLHSTTYNGFGEECATAIEALNIIADDDYVSKSRQAGAMILERIAALQIRFPGLVREGVGQGTLFSIRLNIKTELLESALRVLPVNMVKQDRFVYQVILAGITDWMFSHYNVYTSFTPEGVNFSPPVIVQPAEIESFFAALEGTLEVGLLTTTTTFISNRLFKFLKK